MSRNIEQTVTRAIPVLVEVDRLKDADGRGYFLPNGEDSAVRIVRETDIKRRLKAIFTPQELPLFIGSIKLRQAYDDRDELALYDASQKVRPWIPEFAEIPNFEPRIISERLSFSGVSMKRYSAFLNYSRLMAKMFESARLVMWSPEKEGRFFPALYCPDWKTAAFVLTFTGRIRVCPKCSRIFIAPADNVTYCTPAHRESHRMARSRWRKAKAAKSVLRLRDDG